MGTYQQQECYSITSLPKGYQPPPPIFIYPITYDLHQPITDMLQFPNMSSTDMTDNTGPMINWQKLIWRISLIWYLVSLKNHLIWSDECSTNLQLVLDVLTWLVGWAETYKVTHDSYSSSAVPVKLLLNFFQNFFLVPLFLFGVLLEDVYSWILVRIPQ